VGNAVRRCIRLALVLLAWTAVGGFAQEARQDLNRYYRFPLSVGLEFQSLSPFAAYGRDFSAYSLEADLRVPLPRLPSLQPSLQLGFMPFTDLRGGSVDWSHRHYFAALGLGWAERFARGFELGADLAGGFSLALFPGLDPSGESVSSPNLVARAGARITLNPAFNLSVDIHPTFSYLYSLGPLADYNGLVFGLGFSASYRFGEDPDAPRAIRSIRFERISLGPVFAAMQSFYVRNPAGEVTVTNTDRWPVTELEVSFYQKGFMDSPTPAGTISSLAPGESRTLQLPASFNAEVFATEGVTPLTGEVVAAYKSRGRPAEQRQPVAYDLYDKSAIIWDDDRRIAAFVTPADSAIRNYATFVRKAAGEEELPVYPAAVQFAAQAYAALGELGIVYQPDPVTPFTVVQDASLAVDSVNLPRETLRRGSGDCDDLTALFASLLESVGVRTAFITTPGHIYVALDTQVPSGSFARVHPERGLGVAYNGTVWVPVEITLIGRRGFLEAWRQGAEEYSRYESSPAQRGFQPTAAAQEVFRPVGLRETDLGLQYGSREKIAAAFRGSMTALVDAVVAADRQAAERSNRKQDYNRLAGMYAQYGRYAQAEQALRKSLALDPAYLPARLNLAGLQLAGRQYPQAIAAYESALEGLARGGKPSSDLAAKALINLSRAYYETSAFEKAREAFQRAASIDKAQAEGFAFLAGPASGGEARAAQAPASPRVLFVLEEE
jgi:tetratricopeptide (TPR) repeat protein